MRSVEATRAAYRVGAIAGGVALMVCAASWSSQGSGQAFTATVQQPAGQQKAASSSAIKRGEYLVNAAGCHDCHTPQKLGPEGLEPDMSLMLSGHQAALTLPPPPKPEGPWVVGAAGTMTAWYGPWGVSYAANLTPDPEVGLGQWTEEQFVETIRNGRRQGRGRPILPPMPWPAYRNFSDEDLKAIFAYLRSVPRMKNRVPEPILAPPQN